MMRAAASLLLLALVTGVVQAQTPPSNFNNIVPTAPFGTSNNQAASTAFVQNATGGGSIQVPAICNGVRDNTAIINTAIARAVALGNTKLVFPAGVCVTDTISQQTNRTSGISFQGQGYGQTTLKLKASPSSSGILSIRYADNFTVSDMTLDQNSDTTDSSSALICIQCTNVTYEHIRVINWVQVAVAFNSVATGTIRDSIFIRNSATGGTSYAISVNHSISQNTDINILGNQVINGIIGFDGVRSSISNNVVDGWGFGAAISTGGPTNTCENVAISGNSLANGVGTDVNGVAALGIENACRLSTITGNAIKNTGGAAISSFNQATIIGNNISDCGTVTVGPSKNSVGIILDYAGATLDSSYSTISGNSIANISGSTCEVGVRINSASITGVQLGPNRIVAVTVSNYSNSGTDTRLAANISGNWVTGTLPFTAGDILQAVDSEKFTRLPSVAPVAYTPTVTPGNSGTGGAYVNVTSVASYMTFGKMTCVSISVTYTNIGTGGTYTSITLPNTAASVVSLTGDEQLVTGAPLIAYSLGGNAVIPRNTTTAAPLIPANGANIVLAGCYISS
jgi:hypothetical protein